MCVPVCTYVRTYVYTYVCTYVRTHVRTYVRTYVCTYVKLLQRKQKGKLTKIQPNGAKGPHTQNVFLF